MSIGVYFLNAILCLLCGGLDIFMAVTNYKKGEIFWGRYMAYCMDNSINLSRENHSGILIRENYG